jgi:hypothetical protein
MKIKVITLGYCKAETWRRCVKQLYATKSPDTEWEHLFMYHYYPVNEDNNKRELRQIANEYNLIWIQPEKNLGGCEGFNWAMREYMKDDELILGIGPDSCPTTHGWDLAMYQAMQDKRVGWIGLKQGRISDDELAVRPHTNENINEIDVHLCGQPMMIGMSMVRLDWLRAANGFSQPTKYYGGSEAGSWYALKNKGYELALLRDHFESGEIKEATQDPHYRDWKVEHAQSRYAGNFDEYLKDKGLL